MDVLILSNFPVFPMTLVKARPIGVYEMDDGKERDDKILAVHATDPRFDRYKSIKDVPTHVLLEVKHFFETYKLLQKKEVKVLSAGNTKAAHRIIKESIALYKNKFGSK